MSISYTFQERVINFRSQQVFYLDIFICMTEHDHLQSIISFYELHSFFRYLILKLEKQRQPYTNYIGTTTFCKRFPLPPFNQCFWVCNLHRDHAADELLIHGIDIQRGRGVLMELSLLLLRENPNKLCFIDLSDNIL